MIRTFVMYGTPEDPAAFAKHYHEIHIPLVRKMPHLKPCEITKGPAAIGPEGGEYHLVAILTDDSHANMEAALASAEGQADVANFLSGGVTLLAGEYETV